MVFLLRERVPASESLVSCTGNDRLSLGAHREVEYPMCVTSEGRNHVERRILPNADLILRGRGREPVCRNDLMRGQRPDQVADLYRNELSHQ